MAHTVNEDEIDEAKKLLGKTFGKNVHAAHD